jgi:adenylosuccinate synthase
MVIRRYPIRVAGRSGPLKSEITWEEVAKRAGYPRPIAEYTTVTGNLRRIGDFDEEVVERAVEANRPTGLALHGADYIDYRDYGLTSWDSLGPRTVDFIHYLEDRFGIPVLFVFTGPEGGQLIDRREALGMSTMGSTSLFARTPVR